MIPNGDYPTARSASPWSGKIMCDRRIICMVHLRAYFPLLDRKECVTARNEDFLKQHFLRECVYKRRLDLLY